MKGIVSMLTKQNQWAAFGIFFVLVSGVIACEVPTRLRIEGNPPKFMVSGSGSLRSLLVRGPTKKRDVEGESAYIYWRIRSEKAQTVDEIKSITYGEVPEGYAQIYPESGKAPPLIEGERYYVRLDTANANGAEKFFVIRNNKIDVSDY